MYLPPSLPPGPLPLDGRGGGPGLLPVVPQHQEGRLPAQRGGQGAAGLHQDDPEQGGQVERCGLLQVQG